MAIDRTGECPLCGRLVPLTFHHLIPKKLHRRTHFKKRYSKAELNQGIHICRLCHNGIHDHYDEMTLAKGLSTFERIQADPNIRKHSDWAAKQKPPGTQGQQP
ncbi:MAG: hypothetical protein ACFB0C_24330 [Leptolyngbyaceae cyanobacterium]